MSSDAHWLASLAESSQARMDPALADYVLAGAREGLTSGRASTAWRELEFRPRVLRDVTHVDTSTRPLGGASSSAWGVAPTSLQRVVHPEGEVASARALAGGGMVFVVSSNAGTTFSDIGATGCRWWLQVYLPQNRSLARPLLERAVAAGAEAVVLTVDTPVVGTKYPRRAPASIWEAVAPDAVRVNFEAGYAEQTGSEKATDLGPDDIGWLGEVTALPVVVKGVLHPDDARRCVQAGAAAIWVSNHGGRQLDRSISTAAALGPVVSAVDGVVQVYVDGGVRDGLDVVAALALGADLVFVGRLPLLALLDGEEGVGRMRRELDAQVVETMRLLGCTSVPETRGCVDRHATRRGP